MGGIHLICPRCGNEIDDLPRCPHCGTAPEEGNPPEVDTAESRLVDLLRTADVAYLAVIKSVLDSAGIPYLVQGEEGLRLIPVSTSLGFFRPDAFGAVVRVRREDLADARSLIEEVEEEDESPDLEEEDD